MMYGGDHLLGVKDAVTTRYLRQNAIFADAFNYLIYNGEPVIDPDNLVEPVH